MQGDGGGREGSSSFSGNFVSTQEEFIQMNGILELTHTAFDQCLHLH